MEFERGEIEKKRKIHWRNKKRADFEDNRIERERLEREREELTEKKILLALSLDWKRRVMTR